MKRLEFLTAEISAPRSAPVFDISIQVHPLVLGAGPSLAYYIKYGDAFSQWQKTSRQEFLETWGVNPPTWFVTNNQNLDSNQYSIEVRTRKVAEGETARHDALQPLTSRLSAITERYLPSLMTLEQTQYEMDLLAAHQPELVKRVFRRHDIVTIRAVFRGLLKQRVPLVKSEPILSLLAETEGSPAELVEGLLELLNNL